MRAPVITIEESDSLENAVEKLLEVRNLTNASYEGR